MLRKQKTVWNRFRFYDGNGLARYLEAQAEKGWMLDNIVNNSITFHREEPRKVHYAVVFIPGAEYAEEAARKKESSPTVWEHMQERPEIDPKERDREFLELCAHDGWEVVCGDAYKRIFANSRPDPMPIYSDGETELKNIHRSSLKYIKDYKIWFWISVMRIGLLAAKLITMFTSAVTDNANLLMDLMVIVTNGIVAMPLLTYGLWHRKAEQAVSQGNPLSQVPCGRNRGKLLHDLIYLSLFLLVDVSFLPMLFPLAVIPGLLWLTALLPVRADSEKLAQDKRESRQLIALMVGMALTVFVWGMSMAYNVLTDREVSNSVNRSLAGYALGWEDLEQPLAPEDFLEHNEEEGNVYWDVQASIFAEQYKLEQWVSVDGKSDKFKYEIIKVKAGFLYAPLRDDLLDYGKNSTYVSVDPAPWGAKEAFQLHSGEESFDCYLLCYDGILVEFRPGCELTEDQMRICGEKFLSCVE